MSLTASESGELARLQAILGERQSKYGPPEDNMRGTARHLSALVACWHKVLAMGGELPPHFGALAFVAGKLNRMRWCHHPDNFDDLANYMGFARELSELAEDEGWASPGAALAKLVQTRYGGRHRVYLAGPYSAVDADGEPDLRKIIGHVEDAIAYASVVIDRGHECLCPHAATHDVDQAIKRNELRGGDYESWMRHDFGLIESWATAVCVFASSPGADREAELARGLGLTVYEGIDAVPDVRG